ncbi:MAG: PIN domain-containing protein [Acidimicrobiia bacterium]
MTALDTSVAIPALASWHEAHDRIRRLVSDASIPHHALLETYAVLTRLPPPRRVDTATASLVLARRFPPSSVLDPVRSDVVARLASAGIGGGATYDGIIALTAATHDEVLLTRDRRAASTYERLGVTFELLS